METEQLSSDVNCHHCGMLTASRLLLCSHFMCEGCYVMINNYF